MKQIEINNELLTEAQAAAYLGLKNPKTLAVWRSRKLYSLTYVKYGRTVRYRRKDLEAFIELGVTHIEVPEVRK
jgi:excisionase family DNA binding protein